jgi:hypothetical protein
MPLLARITDPNIAAIANLPDSATGLLQATGTGTAATRTINALGQTLLNTDAAGARSAIGAASPLYVQSRGQNLVTNGTGLLGDNTNFSQLTFDSTELFLGGGSFRRTGTRLDVFSDELIPVDPTKAYEFAVYAKSGNADGSGFLGTETQYAGIACYDADEQQITPRHFMRFPGSTQTTLAAPLNPGDATVQLVSASGWHNGATPGARNLRWYGYTNSKGYTYPPYTYSRNALGNAWGPGGISGNTITLSTPWPGPALPAGTPVSNGQDGGTYKYLGLINTLVPAVWTRYSGKIVGPDTLRDNSSKFPPGTALVRLIFLANFSGANSSSTIRFSGITFTETIAESQPAGTFPELMTFGAGLRLGTGATLSQILTATKTAAGTNPETITVTGAAVGDIAYLSEAVPAKVTAANTVSFNGTGLTGTIRAIVMRAT